MSISFACPHCSKRIKAPDSAAGKRGKCPACQRAVTITAEENSPSETPPRSDQPKAHAGVEKPSSPPPLPKQWYYCRGGNRQGSVSQVQLEGLIHRGELHPSDLVWTEGMNEWLPANEVAALDVGEVVEPQQAVNRNKPEPISAHGSSTPVGWIRAGLLDGIRYFPILLGAMLIMMVINMAAGTVPILGPLLIGGPMACGFWAVALGISRGEQNVISKHMFDGFQCWGTAIVMMLWFALVGTAMTILLLVIPIAAGSATESFGVGVLTAFILFPLAFYIGVRFLLYIPALVVDRNLGLDEAIKATARITSGQKFHTFLLLMLPYVLILYVIAYAIALTMTGVSTLGSPEAALMGILWSLVVAVILQCVVGSASIMPLLHAYRDRIVELKIIRKEH
ncbi:MAG: GYF domain-containing protein [Pirellulaceae bacterium]